MYSVTHTTDASSLDASVSKAVLPSNLGYSILIVGTNANAIIAKENVTTSDLVNLKLSLKVFQAKLRCLAYHYGASIHFLPNDEKQNEDLQDVAFNKWKKYLLHRIYPEVFPLIDNQIEVSVDYGYAFMIPC